MPSIWFIKQWTSNNVLFYKAEIVFFFLKVRYIVRDTSRGNKTAFVVVVIAKKNVNLSFDYFCVVFFLGQKYFTELNLIYHKVLPGQSKG